MKVLHMPIEIAGQIGTLCGALRKAGHLASGYNFFSTYLGYKDYLMNTDMFEMSGMFEGASKFFDLFHYHYGLSIFPQFRDIEMLHELNKPMIMHHWGSDVRFASIAKRNNQYVNTEDAPPEEKIDQDLRKLSRAYYGCDRARLRSFALCGAVLSTRSRHSDRDQYEAIQTGLPAAG